MRAKQERSVTGSARRAQIVAAAIETIAEVGYRNASFARIARRAGLGSTGMISYHFAGKDDLVRAVTADVLATATEYMQQRIAAAVDRPARLRAYIESNVEMVGAYPAHLRALLDIMAGQSHDTGPTVLADRVGRVEAELRDGQRAGEFGEFDPAVLAIAVTGAIDAVVTAHALGTGGAAPITHTARELADLLLRAAGAGERGTS